MAVVATLIMMTMMITLATTFLIVITFAFTEGHLEFNDRKVMLSQVRVT